jgi:Mg-chelatase subunit ChlD
MKNKKTLYHFVVDKSGSMSNCRETTINGFNAQLETIKSLQSEFPEQLFEVSLTIFDEEVDYVLTHIEANNFDYLRFDKYRPSGTTALLDAIGTLINQIRIINESSILNDQISAVIVILTDGMENASREFTYHKIASTIAKLENTEK